MSKHRVRLACGHWTPVVIADDVKKIITRGDYMCEKCMGRVTVTMQVRNLKPTAKLPIRPVRH